MRVSVDTDCWGACELVASITRVNIRDALRFPAVRDAIVHRVKAREKYQLDETRWEWRNPLLQYGSDEKNSPFHTDEWASAVVSLLRCGAILKAANGELIAGDLDAVVIDDCEGLTAIYGSGLILLDVPYDVSVAVTHPLNSDTAHAFNVVGPPEGLRVFDGSVLGQMPRPRPGWYSQNETARLVIEPLRSGRYKK